MNYNPYYFPPYVNQVPTKTGLFSSIFKGMGGVNFSSILTGTQKVLNIANQAIPVIKEVSPVLKNAKTMFRVMNEFKKVDTPNIVNDDIPNTVITDTNSNINNISSEGPTFFI